MVEFVDNHIAKAVTLQGISKRFGATTALRPTDLHVKKGEFLTLLGPSGSGKTTLLNLISGAIEPSSGFIFLGERDITRLPPRDRGIGMVFQNYALMPHMTVYENIAYPLRVRRQPSRIIRNKVMDALARVGLSGFEDRKPRQLSGGQQQRVGIARCIVYSPSIIMMDEPLGALDKNMREHMQTEIKRLHRDLGTTFIYVTHDQEEALNMSDRICLMNMGEIAQLATPDELYFQPRNRFVAEFIGESNLIAGKVCGDLEMMIAGNHSITVPKGNWIEGKELWALIRPENIRICGVNDPVTTEANVLCGNVTSNSFIGGMTRIVVETVTGIHLTVRMVSSRGGSIRDVGEPVKICWNPSDVVVLEN